MRKPRRFGPLDAYFGEHDGADQERVERDFLMALQLSNGTFTVAEPNRLDDLNELVARHLPAKRPLQIMDVAISGGVPTGEWSNQLNGLGIDHELLAGDLVPEALLMSLGRRTAALWEPNGHALMVQLGSKVFRFRKSGRTGFVSRLVSPALRGLYEIGRRLKHSDLGAPPQSRRIVVRPVSLQVRRVRENGAIRIIRDDITQSGWNQPEFDIVRAANILYRGYFSPEVLTHIARNLLARITDGGLLIVCRTHDRDEVNRATIFQKLPNGLVVLERLNGGTEIEDLIVRSAHG